MHIGGKMLKIKINEKMKDNSLEFQSMIDCTKKGSFQMQNLIGFDVLGNKRKEIQVGREMTFEFEEFKILHFDSIYISNGGGVFANDKLVKEALSSFDCGILNQNLQDSYDEFKKLNNTFSIKDIKNTIKNICYRLSKSYKLAVNATPKILFFCPWFDNFTHFTLEAYSRLYFAVKHFRKNNIDFIVVVPPKRREFDTKPLYQSFINPILESLNINENNRIYTNQYNKLISPSFIKINNAYLPTHIKCEPKYTIEAINHLKTYYYDKNFKWDNKNIYISRKKANRRKIANENEVVCFLVKHNFIELNMENLSFKERVNILMRAKNIIGIDGTNLTSMMFMPDNANVVALRTYDMQEFNQITASIFNLNFYCIVCNVNKEIPNHNGEMWFLSDIVVDIDYLEQKLMEYEII